MKTEARKRIADVPVQSFNTYIRGNVAIIIGDDRSITYTQGRLEVNLRPLTDEILNR